MEHNLVIITIRGKVESNTFLPEIYSATWNTSNLNLPRDRSKKIVK